MRLWNQWPFIIGTFPKPNLVELYSDKDSVKTRTQKGMCLDRPLKAGRHFLFSKNCVSLKHEGAFCLFSHWIERAPLLPKPYSYSCLSVLLFTYLRQGIWQWQVIKSYQGTLSHLPWSQPSEVSYWKGLQRFILSFQARLVQFSQWKYDLGP